jgi:curved DNA-binding protein CbpA
MRRLNLAYQTLSDPLQRARYDEELALALARTGVQRASAAASSTVGRFDIDDRDARPTPPHDETAYRSAARHATGRARAEASGSPSRSAASPASPASAYQAMIFDQRSEAMLSRSAIYLVVVLVTVILSLFVYIVIDIVALDGPATPRGPRTQSERTWNASGPASSPYSPILSGVDADARPGLSPSGERWNR